MRPLIRAPDCQAEATATDARHLLGGELLIGREDEAEARTDDVEGAVGERKRLGVAFDPVDVGAPRPRLLEQSRRDVQPGHFGAGAGAGRAQGDLASSGRDVQPALARLRSQRLDEGVVDLRESGGDELVLAAVPELCGAHSSFASSVSLFRASQSSGKNFCLISPPSSSTGVPWVPITSSPMIRETTL